MKKSAIFFLLVIFCSSCALTAAAGGPMREALTKAYAAGKAGDRKVAAHYFKKALARAKRSSSWSGVVDAAMGLLLLGRNEDAFSSFESAEGIAKRKKDWRGEVALAYVYLALPKGFIDKEKALLLFNRAAAFARKINDWRGLEEAAKGYQKLGKDDKYLKAHEEARAIAEGSKDPEQEKEREASYLAYRDYYSLPYYYQYYVDSTYVTQLPAGWLSYWCDHQLDGE